MLPCSPPPQPGFPGVTQQGPLRLLVPVPRCILSQVAQPPRPSGWGRRAGSAWRRAEELFPLGGGNQMRELSRGCGAPGLVVGLCGCPHEADVCQSWESRLVLCPEASIPYRAMALVSHGKEQRGRRASPHCCVRTPHGGDSVHRPRRTRESQCLPHAVPWTMPDLGHFHF